MEPRTFKKKPVEVEAVKWEGDYLDFDFFFAWMNEPPLLHMSTLHEKGADIVTLFIPTLEGTMLALPGDWVIKGIKGEFYPCKPDIFEATYEEVAPASMTGCSHCGTAKADCDKLPAIHRYEPYEQSCCLSCHYGTSTHNAKEDK